MIDVVCDAGSRYTKVVAARPGEKAVVLVARSHEAVDLGALVKQTARALSPGVFEPTRVWMMGDQDAGSPPVLGAALERLGRAAQRPLRTASALARAAGSLGDEVLIADCGALRTRVFEVVKGSAATRSWENERCTSGAGRFIETMAAALHVEPEGIDGCATAAKDPCRVSSPCPVFAESEVVSQINAGRAREDVLAGVVAHAVEKVATLVERARPQGKKLAVVGGLAKLRVFRAGLAAKLSAVTLLDAPVDPMLVPCLAALSQVQDAPAGQWPVVERLPWSLRDAA
ncbi:MAG: BadF/BadG/BcrA/BcrD ATPase family protein [Myxococcales bacterium]